LMATVPLPVDQEIAFCSARDPNIAVGAILDGHERKPRLLCACVVAGKGFAFAAYLLAKGLN
jgi:hypothetical protein